MRKILYEVFFLQEDHYWSSEYFLATSRKAIVDHIRTRRFVNYTIDKSPDDPEDVHPTDLTAK